MSRRELSELASFVLSRETENVREEIYRCMIISIFINKENIPFNELYNSIIEIYTFSDDENLRNVVLQNFDRLKNEGIIKGDKNYYVEEEIKENFLRKQNKYEKLQQNFKRKILSEIKKTVKLENENEFINSLMYALSDLCSKMGKKVVSLFAGEIDLDEPDSDYRIHLLNILKKYNDEEKKLLQECLRNLFISKDKIIKSYLSSISQSYIMASIINIDPECRLIQKNSMQDKILYLDTNILISLLLDGDIRHNAVLNSIKILNSFNLNLKFTKTTYDEYKRRLSASDELSYLSKPASSSVLSDITDLMPDPFIKSYWMKLEDDPSLNWSRFITPYYNIELILKDKYRIEYDSADYKGQINDEEKNNMELVIKSVTETKSLNTTRHDAFHITLIKYLRTIYEASEFGPRVWFLTNDYSLSKVEWLLNSKEIPSSIHLSLLLDIISPILTPESSLHDFGEIISNLIGTAFPSFIDSLETIDVLNVSKDYTDDPDLSIKTIRSLIGDSWVREKLKALRMLPYNSEKYKESMDELYKKVKLTIPEDTKPSNKLSKVLIWIICLLCSIILDILLFNNISNEILRWIVGIEITILLAIPRFYDWFS